MQEERLVAGTALKASAHPLNMLSSFKCLGVISESDDNWPSVVANIREDRKKWAKLSRILGREGVDAKTLGVFYKPLVQVVLLF